MPIRAAKCPARTWSRSGVVWLTTACSLWVRQQRRLCVGGSAHTDIQGSNQQRQKRTQPRAQFETAFRTPAAAAENMKRCHIPGRHHDDPVRLPVMISRRLHKAAFPLRWCGRRIPVRTGHAWLQSPVQNKGPCGDSPARWSVCTSRAAEPARSRCGRDIHHMRQIRHVVLYTATQAAPLWAMVEARNSYLLLRLS